MMSGMCSCSPIARTSSGLRSHRPRQSSKAITRLSSSRSSDTFVNEIRTSIFDVAQGTPAKTLILPNAAGGLCSFKPRRIATGLSLTPCALKREPERSEEGVPHQRRIGLRFEALPGDLSAVAANLRQQHI